MRSKRSRVLAGPLCAQENCDVFNLQGLVASNAAQQAQFEQVERKPQALEWLFSLCAGVPFQVSVDNLGGIAVDREAFTQAVHEQLCAYLTNGIPARAERFARALAKHYQQPWPQCQLQGVA